MYHVVIISSSRYIISTLHVFSLTFQVINHGGLVASGSGYNSALPSPALSVWRHLKRLEPEVQKKRDNLILFF